MSNDCKLGMYVDAGGFGGAAFVTRCACTNCTEREAKVMAEANAKRKALLALDQAMTDLVAPVPYPISVLEQREIYEGRLAAANDAWYNASRFITGGSR